MKQHLHRLQDRLREEPGIRHFVPLQFQFDEVLSSVKSIEDMFMHQSRFVITGSAGCGKTTLMRWLALQLVNDALDSEEVRQLSVWLSLSAWDEGQTLETFVRKQWANIENPLATLAQNNAVVFLDGLDELGTQTVTKIEQLNTWLQGYDRPHKVIATCRTQHYPTLNLDWPTLVVAPQLTPAQIYVLAQNYLAEKAEPFLTFIRHDLSTNTEISHLQIGSGRFATEQAYHNHLRDLLNKHFNLEEFKSLCFDLDIDYDNLGGEGKINKARELVLFLRRMDRLAEIEQAIPALRPKALWPDRLQPVPPQSLKTRLQALTQQYTEGKNLDLMAEIISESRDSEDNRTYSLNLLQSFTQTPFQLVVLMRYFAESSHQSRLPLNLGRVTHVMIQAIWEREQARRAEGWIPLAHLTAVLDGYAESAIADRGHEYSECPQLEGFSLQDTVEKFDHALMWVGHVPGKNFLPRPTGDKTKAEALLNTLLSAGILQLTAHGTDHQTSCISFRDVCFLEYFAAYAFAGDDPAPLFVRGKYQNGWQRFSLRWDRVVLALAGIAEKPQELLSTLSAIQKNPKEGVYEYDRSRPHDLYITAKCLLTLGRNTVEPAFLNELADGLLSTMLDRRDAAEQRCVDYANMVYFWGNSLDVSDIVVTLQKLYPYDWYQEKIKRVLVLLGQDTKLQKGVVQSLIKETQERWRGDYEDRKTAQYLIRALGQIGHPQARQPLQNILEEIEISGSRDNILYGPLLVALFQLGSNKAQAQMIRYLEPGESDRQGDIKQRWVYARDLNIEFIPQLVDLLYRYDNPDTMFVSVVAQFGSEAIPFLVQALEQARGEDHPYRSAPIHPYVQATLIKSLGEIGGKQASQVIGSFLDDDTLDPIVCQAAINVVSKLPEAFAPECLYPLLKNESPVVRSLAAGALGKFGNAQVIRPLKRLLDDNTKVHRQYGYGVAEAVCEFAVDALCAINTPEAQQLAFEWYKKRLLAIPPGHYEEASHARLGLQSMATNEAWKVLNQWESQA